MNIYRWLVMDIGCIECGEESVVVGTFPTKEEADEKVLSLTGTDGGGYFNGGQHYIEVFDLGKNEV